MRELKIGKGKLPRHVAFIMDGNGRWATRRGLPRTAGHAIGYDKMKMCIKHCSDRGIEVCSIYAFSTENWNRPQAEIDEIFRLIRENMSNDVPLFMKWNVRVETMGDLTRFPKDLYDKLCEIKAETAGNTGIVFNLCANYGGRADITQAVNKILAGRKVTLAVTEDEIQENLYGADLPAPDLIVRTSGEQRVSNFMLWQMAYSEFLFIKPHWPSMSKRLIDKCIVNYSKRKRRFGKV